ncbi:MAG: hypothetical protein PF448_08710 [Bacteroidales bacterium]|jgi:hypothetical protein|nr:hypothetical protein [Bacteroidales bacterium]
MSSGARKYFEKEQEAVEDAAKDKLMKVFLELTESFETVEADPLGLDAQNLVWLIENKQKIIGFRNLIDSVKS